MEDTRPSFRPIEAVRLSDEAVDQIQEMVLKGDLSPGDRLPGERALARQLRVSRTAVRDALRILEGMGVVEVRPGRGTFIASELSEATSPLRWKEWLGEHREQTSQIMEVRELLEVKVAQWATEKATTADIQSMERSVDLMEQAIRRNDVDAMVAADRAFHDTLGRASGNQVIALMRESLYLALQGQTQTVFRMTSRGPDSLKEHQAILAAVRDLDTPGAARAMLHHMRNVAQVLLEIAEREEGVSQAEMMLTSE
jgi:GntR family transcriptional repressor for pyruvate dehydrogenase complex